MGRRGVNTDANGGAMTLATVVYEQIRSDILSGALKPRDKLRIELLKKRYQTGSSPIREALNRLSAERFVVQHDQRGFYVAAVSLAEFQELTRTRSLIYEIAIRESLAHGDAAWEERIVIAMHRLSRAPWLIEGDPRRPNPEARKAHRELHRALVGACGSTWLLDFADSLFDQADRYRFLSHSSGDGAKRDSNAEHRKLVEATLARDVELTTRLTLEHIQRTGDLVNKRLASLAAAAASADETTDASATSAACDVPPMSSHPAARG
jgi:DNA-binding GntR family transcriptional regulator